MTAVAGTDKRDIAITGMTCASCVHSVETALAAVAGQDWSALSALTQRYSAVLRERPADPVAQKAIDHLVQVAMSLPVPTKGATEAQAIQTVLKGAVGILMMAMAVIILVYLTRR